MKRINSRTVEFTTAAEQLAADYLDQEFDKGKGYPEAARSALDEGAAATLRIPVGRFSNEFVSYLSDGTLVLVGGQRSLLNRRLVEVSQGNERGSMDPWLGVFIAVVAGMLSLLVLSTRADASPEFRAACIDAHRSPYAPTGKLCRSKGWTVRHHIVTTPRRVVVYDTLPPCTNEDGSGGPVPCIWHGHKQGNGHGVTYYVTRIDHPHYVWGHSPTLDGWRWLPPRFVKRLEAKDKHNRERWSACAIRNDRSHVVLCPDGWWTTS